MKHLIVAAAAVLAFSGAHAQVNPQFADMSGEIDMVRSLAKQERRTVIEAAMQLTAEQSPKFWDIYNAYEKDMHVVGDKLVKVITDYAAVYESMDDKQAAAIVKEYFAQKEAEVKTRKKYISKFSKVLSQKQVARFYQVEGKFDALRNLQLARQIPLVK